MAKCVDGIKENVDLSIQYCASIQVTLNIIFGALSCVMEATGCTSIL